MTSSAGLESRGQPKLTCSSWDPHHNCVQIVTANDTYIRGWDLRTMQYVTLHKLTTHIYCCCYMCCIFLLNKICFLTQAWVRISFTYDLGIFKL